jgi:hypothetical protein
MRLFVATDAMDVRAAFFPFIRQTKVKPTFLETPEEAKTFFAERKRNGCAVAVSEIPYRDGTHGHELLDYALERNFPGVLVFIGALPSHHPEVQNLLMSRKRVQYLRYTGVSHFGLQLGKLLQV